jgi:hypothetical protein
MFLNNEKVTLKTGMEADSMVIALIMIYLNQLHEYNYSLFKKLVNKCRYADQDLSDADFNLLKQYHLSENGVISNLVRNVVLSSIEENDHGMILLTPTEIDPAAAVCIIC